MIERLVVAYDGSDLGREAFAYALELARSARVPVVAVCVLEPATSPMILAEPSAATASLDAPDPAFTHDEASALLNELAAFAGRAGVELETRIERGEVIDRIARLASPGDLVAVGAKGRFASGGFGSATRALVERGPCPVLVAGGPLRDLSRVLAVYDWSRPARRAVEWARGVAKQTGWPLTVLAVASDDASIDGVLQKAQDLAPEANVFSYAHEGASKAAQIEAAGAHTTHSVIAMGAYADSWLHRLVFGETTASVLRRLDAPLVLVR
ncbi:MAG: universal stress protein [Phycisphaerales bacterium JB059]